MRFEAYFHNRSLSVSNHLLSVAGNFIRHLSPRHRQHRMKLRTFRRTAYMLSQCDANVRIPAFPSWPGIKAMICWWTASFALTFAVSQIWWRTDHLVAVESYISNPAVTNTYPNGTREYIQALHSFGSTNNFFLQFEILLSKSAGESTKYTRKNSELDISVFIKRWV
jgi:hypothetical protein